MKVVITGASGQLGQTFCRMLAAPEWEVCSLSHQDCDIVSLEQVQLKLETLAPDVIINCAAYTAVDKAEGDRERCFAVNATAVGNLAKVANSINARFVHVSTDYVFDGRQREPYTESSPTAPLNEYGRSKLVGEQLSLEYHPNSLVVRTSWLYGITGHNFIRAIVRGARERGSLRVVSDQIGVPTSTETLAERIVTLLQLGERGVFHITNGGCCSWFEFAAEIMDAIGWKHVPITECATADLKLPAARPLFSVMDNARWRALGLPQQLHWRECFRQQFPRMNIDSTLPA